MLKTTANRTLSLLMSLILVAAFALPVPALAAQPRVEIENHTAGGQKAASGITIDGVDAPTPGKALDNMAQASTAEGDTWDIPVLWIDDNLQLATEAVEGRTYLPALAFFVPSGYSVEGGTFAVQLSESLTALFGSQEIVSVYVPSTGVTYLLPSSLKNFFTPPVASKAASGYAAATIATPEQPTTIATPEQPATEGEPAVGTPATQSLIDIYCAQTARDVFTDEDLSWFIDLVVNRLQPQAVNLLIDKFPAFSAAAQSGDLGERIGLYIYMNHGDKDGVHEHENASQALAYVAGDAAKFDGTYKFGYMIGIDLDDLTQKDSKQDDYRINPKTGKYILQRDGAHMRAFENTIVHEMFHAFTYDYNRTGMIGGTNAEDVVVNPDGSWKSEAQRNLYNSLHFPLWFIEGSASSVENVFQFRHGDFESVYPVMGPNATTKERTETMLEGYLDNTEITDDGLRLVDIGYSGMENGAINVDSVIPRYVTGYLATMYLSELAARSNESIGTSIGGTKENVTFSASKLRMGLNSILERLNNGETLDDIVNSVSTTTDENGKKVVLYKDTSDFEEKFIKGTRGKGEQARYNGDPHSLSFSVQFVDYLRSLEPKLDGTKTNGSILEDFDVKYTSPLDPKWEGESSYYKIVKSNRFEESTVPDSEALKTGGKTKGSAKPPKTEDELKAESPASEESQEILDILLDTAAAITSTEQALATKAAASKSSPESTAAANHAATDENAAAVAADARKAASGASSANSQPTGKKAATADDSSADEPTAASKSAATGKQMTGAKESGDDNTNAAASNSATSKNTPAKNDVNAAGKKAA